MARYTTFQWLAPELARLGLLKNEPWIEKAAHEAAAMFDTRTQHRLQIAAVLTAALHPYAIDYLKQAPVIAMGVAKYADLSLAAERQAIATTLAPIFRKGLRLREFMDQLQLAYPLRALAANALPALPRANDILLLLRDLPLSTLAQIIPREDSAQTNWLNGLLYWIWRMLRHRGDARTLFRWAAQAIGPMHDGDMFFVFRVCAVADFAAACSARFDERWTFARAFTEAVAWHDELAGRSQEQEFLAMHGIAWTDRIDYSPLPERIGVNGYDIVALSSGADLFAEGQAMHHCVASYAAHVVSGRSRIYSIRKGDKRLATFELVRTGPPDDHAIGLSRADFRRTCLRPPTVAAGAGPIQQYWRVAQLVGPDNSMVSMEIARIVVIALEKLSGRSPPTFE